VKTFATAGRTSATVAKIFEMRSEAEASGIAGKTSATAVRTSAIDAKIYGIDWRTG